MRGARVLIVGFMLFAFAGIAIAEEVVSPAASTRPGVQLNSRLGPSRAERSELVIVDGTGRIMGNVLDIPQGSGRALVPVTVNHLGLVLEVEIFQPPTRIEGVFSGLYAYSCLFFVSTDCTGPALIQSDDLIQPNAAVAPPAQTLYVARPGSTPQAYSTSSFLCNAQSCVTSEAGGYRTEAVPVTRLDLVFPPPYRLVVRRVSRDD